MIWPILDARAEIQKYFCSFFGSNKDIQKSFWNYLTFRLFTLSRKAKGQWFGWFWGDWTRLKTPSEITPPLNPRFGNRAWSTPTLTRVSIMELNDKLYHVEYNYWVHFFRCLKVTRLEGNFNVCLKWSSDKQTKTGPIFIT